LGDLDVGKMRYERQMRISGWGESGQSDLANASLLVAGVGGLGCTSANLLARAGVGRLLLADSETVEEPDLNRQILYGEDDVGMSKAEVARLRLSGINHEPRIEAFEDEISEGTVDSLLEGIDGVVDGLDNFGTRYLLNDRCFRAGIPLFHGSVFGFEGRASTFVPGRSPCLRCLYPSAQEEDLLPIAGPVPSVVGSIQALEAIKYLLRMPDLLTGRLLLFDGEDLTCSEVEIQSRPNCPVCAQPHSTA
jgi:adenylyltransferase/sulfurtransferase